MTHQKKTKYISQKWSLASLLLLASGLVIVGICVYLLAYGTHKIDTPLIDNGRVAKNDALFKNYDIAYPIFHIEKVDMMVRNYTTHQVDDFLRRLGSNKNDSRAQLTIKYTILHYDTHTVTIMFHKREKLPNKSEVLSRSTVTYDLRTQKQLNLIDIFKDRTTANKLFGRILHDYFQHSEPQKFTSGELGQLASSKLENIQEFVLGNDAITLYIDPHQPAFVQEDETISIKKDLLLGVLNDAFIIQNPSLTREAIEQPTYSINAMPKHDIVINPNAKMLALTFDDGPGSLTPSVLDVLKNNDAHATFFVIGRQVSMYAAVVQREVAEGNEVGNHSWSHPNLTRLSYGQLQQQINDTQQAIKQVTGGYTPVLMRPPEGVFNNAVVAYVRSQGLSIQLWNVDTLDWLNRDPQVVYDRIMSAASDGRVILVHDIHPTSVDAVNRAIPQLVSQGYQLVTMSELRRYR